MIQHQNEKQVTSSKGTVYKIVSKEVSYEELEKMDALVKQSPESKDFFEQIPKEQMMVLEIHLKDLTEDVEVQPDGSITFLLEYMGDSTEDHDFHILHLEGGTKPVVLAEGRDYKRTDKGLLITVNSFSPFVIGWTLAEAEQQEELVREEMSVQDKEEAPVDQSSVTKEEKAEGSRTYILIIILLSIIVLAGTAYIVKDKLMSDKKSVGGKKDV